MKKNLIAISAFVISIVFTSCQKDSGSPATADITGTWSFVSMDAATSSVAESNDAGVTEKTITTSNYTTQNNSGTITINGSSMTSSNLSYSVNTTAHASYYSGGTLLGTFDVPLTFDVPASSGVTSYKVVSSDSLYFESGTVFSDGVSQNSIPAGAKISLQGNILYMTQHVANTQTLSYGGATVTSTTDVTATIKLQKQ